MEALSQMEIIGAVVIGLAAILALFKYISDHIEKQNSIYSQFNENLIKNTMAIDNLNNYIEKMEREVKDTLTEHEKRLDQHQEALIKLENCNNLKTIKEKDEN